MEPGVMGTNDSPNKAKNEQSKKNVAAVNMEKQESIVVIGQPGDRKTDYQKPVKYSGWSVPDNGFC